MNQKEIKEVRRMKEEDLKDAKEVLKTIDKYIGLLEELKVIALSLKNHMIELEEEVQEAKRKGGSKKMDIKKLYQEKAEELAREEGKEFEELPVVRQEMIYEMAIVLVGEELQEAADLRREEERINGEE